MKNEDPLPIRFHDLDARDPHEVAEFVAERLLFWARELSVTDLAHIRDSSDATRMARIEWAVTCAFQQLVRKARFGAKPK